MIAAYLDNGRVTIRHRPKPRLREGHALIRLLCAGICNTDLELQRGYYRFRGIPGHEFVGEVVDSPEPSLVGCRVVGEINLNCDRCDWCRQGVGRHCPRRTVLGIVKHPGAFAEYLSLPVANLHTVPEEVPTQAAVFTEPIAAACEILEQVRIRRGEEVAVLGDGKLGLLVGQVLQAHGAAVRLFGLDERKLRLARSFGLHARRSSARMPAAAFRWVVEATGRAAGLRRAVSMTQPRGTVIVKSTMHSAVPLDTALVVVNEITLIGSRCGPFEPALRLLRQRKIRTEEMISARFPLREAPAAFEKAAQRGVLKVLLIP
jgi:threonine dehydrogenase-like Zn-dependent dehydrogenase